MDTEYNEEEKLQIRKKTYKQLMYVGIFSIIMFFGGLSSAYIVSRADGTWVKIFPPSVFYVSSITILLSSITYILAVRFISQEKYKLGSALVGVTLILGILFVGFQMQGWKYLNERGNHMGGYNNIRFLVENNKATYGKDYVIVQKGKELAYHNNEFYDKRDVNFSQPILKVNLEASNNASSYFFILTGMHILHLFGGLISLIIVFFKSIRKKYSKNDHVGIKVSAIYWHFLDFLWLYLLGLLYFVG